MSQAGAISVRFWGVRGSIACPGSETVRYGGNTSCIEVRCGEHLLIFDAGTGLRPLGKTLAAKGATLDTDLFFSHTHFDHVLGIPFFAPLFIPGCKVRMWAGHLLPEHRIEEVLGDMMMAPLFPVPMEVFRASIEFHNFKCGETLHPRPDITLHTRGLNHPNGATGYRLEYGGKVIAYITDTEHRQGEFDPNVLALIDHADLMVYDCTYTDEEYPKFATWGHSTWQEGCRLAEAAHVKTLAVFHHDPAHDDAFMDRIADEAAEMRPGTIVAHEGMQLHI